MKTNVRWFEVAAIMCVALLGTTTAIAGEREKKKAKTHAKNAAKLFEAESYELALKEFEKAYDLYPVPGLLFNMGQCNLFLGEHEKAIQLFEQFLSEKPDTPYRADVERLIGEAKAEIEKKRAAEAPPPPPIVEAPPPPPEEEEEDPIYGQWWFWTIIGGVAVAGGATAIALTAGGGETTTVLPMGDLGLLDRR